MFELSTDKTVSEAASALQVAVKANPLGVLRVHNLKGTMAKKGVELAREHLIFKDNKNRPHSKEKSTLKHLNLQGPHDHNDRRPSRRLVEDGVNLATRNAGDQAMAKTLRAAVVWLLGKPIVIENRPAPNPPTARRLSGTRSAGFATPNVHAVDGDEPFKSKIPFTPGHKGVGRIVGLRCGAENVKEGDRDSQRTGMLIPGTMLARVSALRRP